MLDSIQPWPQVGIKRKETSPGFCQKLALSGTFIVLILTCVAEFFYIFSTPVPFTGPCSQ